jgi:hypothetical protein
MKKIISLFSFIAVVSTMVFMPVLSAHAQISIDFPPINTNRNKPVVLDIPCIQAAIEKRDTAIIAGLDTYAPAVKTALQTRKDELKAGWALTEKNARKTALKNAWKKYRESVRTARRTFRDAKRNAWKQFSTDRKACNAAPMSEDSTGQGVDETL